VKQKIIKQNQTTIAVTDALQFAEARGGVGTKRKKKRMEKEKGGTQRRLQKPPLPAHACGGEGLGAAATAATSQQVAAGCSCCSWEQLQQLQRCAAATRGRRSVEY
jgi:hypothetical protein